MALYQLATFPISTVIKLTFPRRSSLGLSRNGHVRCMVATESCDKSISRRSGNYPTPFLDHEFLQSLTSGYVGEAYTGQANKLKETVKNMLENPLTALGQLELIDCLQRLGLAYQFEQEIKSILESRWNDYQNDNREMKEDLYATSVEFRLLRQHGYNVPQGCLDWVDLCRAYLKEAKWYYAGYTPSLQEYLDNAWLTSSGQVILAHAFLLVTNHLTEEAISCCMEYPDIIRYSSTILRLVNDLGTSSDEIARGDIPKSIQCYMHETGATEEEAREHIQYLIYETWKKLNEERWKPHPFSQKFMGIPMNLARTALCFYEEGDGYGIQDHETRGRLASLIVKPIPLRDM
ncbi:hypothetical protein OIU77_016533 [Salix suchowensis]|uniref:Terpene synthase metal-binding domain-containing protein n=1 Tax=Salix suchowensis TaxID=1278906 RepID=A0ABQ8ZKN5_9ROSI|nr:hypothetical protein OIU77_016533 [Salix suchowensis]